MQFLQPLMLLTLGLIPVLILIHLLKPKPKLVEVTNLFLWQELLKERGGSVTLKRLRKNLPLLFQILMIMLAAAALAKPVWSYFAPKTGAVILVIDTSASMKTIAAPKTTRFDLARQKALALIAQCAPPQKILIVEAGNQPAVPAGFVDNLDQAKDLVKRLKPSDAPGKLEKAMYLALSFVDPAKDDAIYLITDGAGGEFLKLLQLHPRIIPLLVAGGEKNLGITKFEFRQESDQPDQYEMMLEVQNFTAAPLTCPLRLSVDNITLVDAPMTFAAQAKQVLIFPYAGLLTGIAKAELDLQDDFSVDNTAYLSLSGSKDLWVMFVSPGNYFLEKLLAAYPNFLVNAVKEIAPGSWETQVLQHDLVIVDRMAFPATPKGNVLALDAASPSIPAVKTGAIDFPQVLAWDQKSPLMANVNVNGLTIERAAKFQPDPNLRPVIESAETGLLYTYEKDGLRAVVLGFDLTRSDLPLRVAFPVLMSNIINWLNPQKLGFSALQTKAGEPYPIETRLETREIAVRAPDGKWQSYPVTARPLSYTNTGQTGIYTILENEKSRYFTVNLVDAAESDITTPAFDVSARASSAAASDLEQIATQQQLWSFFLLAGLAIILVEWHVWLKTG